MNSTLGKFTRPRPVGALLRQRLFTAMDSARRHPAVWISGPPGCGKTTMASTYLAERRLPCVWYRMHAEDGDAATFFHYFALAVKDGGRGGRAAPLPHLTPEFLANLPVFSRRYFEQAYKRLKAPCALVFDNYEHAGSGGALHEAMRELVESLPEGIGAVFLSRGEPPSAFAQARARGLLSVIDGEKFRLTAEESSEIADLRGVRIDERALERLHERTQGWAAGLVLALEQSGQPESGAGFPAEATPQVVFDYFAGEILHRMQPHEQALLLKAALLPTMAPQRAIELSSAADAGEVLEGLARANYFTLKLSSSRGQPPVYQFHPLFREFLLRRGEEALLPAELDLLRRKAAALLESDADTGEAVSLLTAAKAWPEALAVVLRHAAEMLEQGRAGVLEAWLHALPPHARDAAPWALYWLGRCRLPFDPVAARRHFEQAFAGFEKDDDAEGQFLSWASLIDTFVYEWSAFAPVDRWIAVLDRLLVRHPAFPSPEVEARVSAGMFMALMYRQPQRADLPNWAARVHEIVLASPQVETQMLLGNQLVLYHTLCIGDVAKARIIVDAVRPGADGDRISPLASVLWRCVEAAYYLATAAPEDCMRAVESGMEVAEREGLNVLSFFLLFQGVVSKLKLGDREAAARLLERAKGAMRPGRMLDRAHYHYLLVLYAFHTADASSTLENATEAVRLADAAGVPFSQAYYRHALSHALFDRGARREALVALGHARRIGRAARSENLEFGAYFSLAFFALERGRRRRALPLLRKALALSKASGFFNRLLWTPASLTRVVVAALENGIEVEHAQSIVRRCGLVPPREALQLDHWPFRVKVHTLGRFGVVLDGKPLEFDGKAQKKPLELLMALVAFGGRGVSELQLTEALWPDAEGDAAHKACAIALHRLRKLLGCEQAIVLRRNELTLDPAHVWVDAWAFERALSEAPESGRVESLYNGGFLPQVDAPWATPLRMRLRAKFTRHIAERGRTLAADGQHSRAIDAFERGLEADGQLEELYHGLMLCHAALGRRAEAIGVYRRCEKILAATLGIAPGTKTVALYETLQR